MPVTCVVVDDEPAALNLVRSYAEKTAFLTLQGAFTDSIKALEFIKQNQPKLVFLDINMPDLNGMDLSKLIPRETRVIFTTAYDQYAVESYKLDALYYLLKPFSYAELVARVKAILRRLNNASDVTESTMKLDESSYSVKYKSSSIELTNFEFQLFKPLFKIKK